MSRVRAETHSAARAGFVKVLAIAIIQRKARTARRINPRMGVDPVKRISDLRTQGSEMMNVIMIMIMMVMMMLDRKPMQAMPLRRSHESCKEGC